MLIWHKFCPSPISFLFNYRAWMRGLEVQEPSCDWEGENQTLKIEQKEKRYVNQPWNTVLPFSLAPWGRAINRKFHAAIQNSTNSCICGGRNKNFITYMLVWLKWDLKIKSSSLSLYSGWNRSKKKKNNGLSQEDTTNRAKARTQASWFSIQYHFYCTCCHTKENYLPTVYPLPGTVLGYTRRQKIYKIILLSYQTNAI